MSFGSEKESENITDKDKNILALGIFPFDARKQPPR
jgi:hypothetical protein